jgi:hypothetical protein
MKKEIEEADLTEALKQVTYLSAILPDWQRVNNGVDSLSIIKQALTTKSKKEQAFDIIKEYQVDTWLLNQCDYENYIRIRKEARVSIEQIINEDGESVEEEISYEEFNLVKEVLNDNSQE